jgi:hypothetical protein
MTIELIVGDGKPLQNASLPIRWCIDAQTLNRIKEQGGADAQILLVSIDEKGGEERVMVPLSQGMTFFNIRRPGESTINAFVVWARGDTHLNKLKNYFLMYSSGSFDYRLVLSGKIYIDKDSPVFQIFDDSSKVNVVIPIDLFGKEPAAWFKSLVNVWSTRQPTLMDDECSWRRRVIMFFLFKIWFVAAYVVAYEVFALAWSIGAFLIGVKANYVAMKHVPIG